MKVGNLAALRALTKADQKVVHSAAKKAAATAGYSAAKKDESKVA